MAKFIVEKSVNTNRWHWVLLDNQGNTMAFRDYYLSRWTAERGVRRFKQLSAIADVEAEVAA